jgi:hypothetical protein
MTLSLFENSYCAIKIQSIIVREESLSVLSRDLFIILINIILCWHIEHFRQLEVEQFVSTRICTSKLFFLINVDYFTSSEVVIEHYIKRVRCDDLLKSCFLRLIANRKIG